MIGFNYFSGKEDEDVDDEEMGIYASGGSPLHGRKRMAGTDESESRSSRYNLNKNNTLTRHNKV
jgi:hypothetical protein